MASGIINCGSNFDRILFLKFNMDYVDQRSYLEDNDIFNLFMVIRYNKLWRLRFYIDIYLGLINFIVHKFWVIGPTFRFGNFFG